MNEMCGTSCCERCSKLGTVCAGCAATAGHPCGGSCVAAEIFRRGGLPAVKEQKQAIINEVNAQRIPGLQINDLKLLNGDDVNLTYPLGGQTQVHLLNGKRTYWGMQVDLPGSDRSYGIMADDQLLIVAEYGEYGADPELVLYKRRNPTP